MKKKDLISSLSFMKDFTIIPDSYYVLSGEKRESKKKYNPASDRRFSDLFKGTSVNKSETRRRLALAALTICDNLSFEFLSPPTEEQMVQMLKISGYTAEEMKQYYLDIGMKPSFSSIEACDSLIVLLSRCLYDAMHERAKHRTSDFSRLEILDSLLVYIEDNEILHNFNHREYSDSDEEAKRAYEDFVRRGAMTAVMSRAVNFEHEKAMPFLVGRSLASMPHSQIFGKNFIPEITPYKAPLSDEQENFLSQVGEKDPSRVSVHHVCDEFYDMLNAAIGEIEAENTKYVSESSFPLISKGFLLEFLDGDDIYQCLLGEYVLLELINDSGIPIGFGGIQTPGESEEEDNLIKIFDRSSIMYVFQPSSKEEEGGFRSLIPISSLLSTASGYAMPDSLYCKKNYIQFFKDAGFSGREARDFSVLLALGEYMDSANNTTASSKGTPLLDKFPEEKKESKTEPGSVSEEAKETILSLRNEIQKLHEREEAAEKNRKKVEKENQELRHQILELQKESGKLEKDLQNEKQEKENAVREILDSLAEEKMPQEAPGIFPYHTSKRIIVYGAFPNFEKELLSLIPGIRIIRCINHTDLNPIRNADLVFMQINCTSHSGYWAAREMCKKCGVPLVYLNASNARMCAEKMVYAIENIEKKSA